MDHEVPDEQLREVQELLPVGTRRCHDTFRRCDCCWRVYRHGANGDRLRRVVDAAAG